MVSVGFHGPYQDGEHGYFCDHKPSTRGCLDLEAKGEFKTCAPAPYSFIFFKNSFIFFKALGSHVLTIVLTIVLL